MFQHSSRRAISLALLLVASITFQGFAFMPGGVVMAQKLKPLKSPVTPKGPNVVPVALAPNISVATMTDNRNPGTDPAMAAPGDTITYTATISNTGADPATGVTFSVNLDTHTTPGTVSTQPVTVPDTYTASGNIEIFKAAPGVMANDIDPDTGNNSGLTVSKVQGAALNVGAATDTTAVGRGAVKGSVTLNSDGSFTYEPPPGYVGADSFTYEVTDGTHTDTNTVNITISGMVWFISNSGGGSNRGTFSNPFTSIASFNTANNVGGAAATPNPKDGDLISIRSGNYSEADGVNLRAQQKLIGEAIVFNTVFTADANSSSAYMTFAGAAGTAPNIVTTAGNGIDLLTDNTVRGLNVGSTSGFKINGGAVGSPIINTVNLTGAGGALNVSTSGTFGANVSFGTFESTSSTSSNLNLVGVTGTLGITSGGTGLALSAAGSNAVNVSGGTVSFTYPGNVSKTTTGALVNIVGGHNTGTIGFNTGTLSATSGTGFQFSNADGTYNFNGTNTLNGGDAGVDILSDSSGTFTFSASSTITSPTPGAAFNVGSSPGAPNVTYSGSITYNTVSQVAVSINGTTGGTVSIATVNAGTTAGGVNNLGVNINNASGNVNFTNLNLGTSGTRMVNQALTIAGGSGTYNLGTVSIFTGSGATGIGAANADGAINSTGGTVDASNGMAISIDGPAGLTTLGMTLGTVNSSGGVNNINLIEDAGSLTINAGALSGATGTSFNVSNSTLSVTYSGGISQATANQALLSVTNHSTGIITFQTGTLSATNGTGLQFNNADGTYNFNGTTTLGGGDAGIDISNGSGGTFAFGGTTITNPTGVGLNVDGSVAAVTGPISISGTISKTSGGRLIDFNNYDTGTATISGTLTCNTACDGIEVTNDGLSSGTVNFTGGTKTLNTVTDTAVNLDNNDGGNINFTNGGLDIDTTSGTGFNAINGGTVTVTGSANTIDCSTGTALSINGTTIGASDVTFRSISANGAANGIVLNTTGALGELIVTGSGSAGTGGTIQNTTGDAISLTSTQTPAFSFLNVTGTGGQGINATSLTAGLTLTSCQIINTGNGDNEHAMKLLNVSGTVSIQGTTFNNTTEDFINIDTTTVSPNNADMILNVGTVTACTFTQPNTLASIRAAGAFAGNGILTTGRFSKNYTFNISNSTFTDIKLFGFQFGSSGPGATQSTATNCNVNITNNQFQVSAAITNAIGNTNNRANTINVQGLNAIDIDASIVGNTLNRGGGGGIQFGADQSANINANITGNTVTNQFADGILMAVDENASLTVLIDSNTITNTSSDGMEIANAISPGGVSTLNATITNNTVTTTNTNVGLNAFFAGIGVFGGVEAADVTFVNVTGNTVGGSPASSFDYALDGSSFGDQIILQGPGAGAVAEADFLAAPPPQNTANSAPGLKTFIGNTFYSNGATVPLPTLTAAAPDIIPRWKDWPGGAFDGAYVVTAEPTQSSNDVAVEIAAINFAPAIETTASGSHTTTVQPLVNLMLDSQRVVPDASAYAERESATTLPTTVVRSSSDNSGSQSKEVKANHAYKGSMAESSVRETAVVTPPAPIAPVGGGTITVNIGTLAPGDSVTITFTVTVDNPPNLSLLNPPRVSQQGTVSGGNFAPVMTDDTDVVGAANPTVTLIDLFNVSVGVVAAPVSPTDFGDAVTFTATLTETPPQGVDPTGTIQFLDGVTPLTCTEGANPRPVSGSAASCTTSALTSGAHTINANYSGDGNFDANTGNISHTVNPCVTDPVVTQDDDAGDGTCDATCTLREAVIKACNGSTITFDTATTFSTAQTITLALGELPVGKNVTIDGPDTVGNHVTVSGGGTARVFSVIAGKTVTISDLTISGGTGAADGGGVFNLGTLNLIRSTISGNILASNYGAGIFNGVGAVMNINDSTISGNTVGAGVGGGGVRNEGTMNITNSTISGNGADDGGGINNSAGTLTITNSTITNNRADNDNNGAGVGGGIFVGGGTVTLRNSIVAGNFNEDGPTDADDDISGVMNGGGNSTHNRIGTCAGCALTDGLDNNELNVTAAELNLGALANNGGPTLTHKLGVGSIAIDTGNNAYVTAPPFLTAPPTTDQRGTGFPRIADSADANTTATVDIGAFELHPSMEDIADTSTNEDTAKVITFNLGDDNGALISSVTATSGNTTLVPNANIGITGGPNTRTLTITPAANRNSTLDGTATITVTVTASNGQTAQDTFVLTVNAVNDPPSFSLAGNPPAVNESSGAQSVPAFATSISSGPNESGQVLTFTVSPVSSTGTLTFSSAPAIDATTGELTYTPTNGTDGTATFSVTLSDDGSNVSPNSNTSAAQQFTITVNNVPLTLGGTIWNDNGAGGGIVGNGIKDGTEPGINGVAISLFVDSDDNDAPDTPGTALATATTAGGGNYSFTNLSPGNFIVRVDQDNFDAGGNVSLVSTPLSPVTVPEPPDPDNNLDNDDNGSRVPAQPAFSKAITLSHDNEPTAGAGNNTNNTVDFGFLGNPAPSINNLGGDTSTFTEDGPAVALDVSTAATVTDDQTHFNGGNLTVSTTGNEVAAEDVLAISTSGSVSLSAGMTVGSIVSVGGNPIGSITSNGTGGNDLVVTFTTTDATPANVGTLIQALIYSNSNTSNPSTLQRTIAVSVNDGLGGTDSENVFVNVVNNFDVNVHDAKIAEPSSGSANMAFTVALDAPATGTVNVNFTTADEPPGPGKAVAGNDYTSTNGTVTFNAGQQVKVISVPVLADGTAGEPDETFLVNLTGATGATIVDNQAVGTITAANPAGTLLISELRTSGPDPDGGGAMTGAGNEFVELYNNTDSPVDISGYGLFKMGATCSDSPVLIGTVPPATTIPARGHFLFVGSEYGLGSYAAGDVTLTADIESDANVAVFSTANLALISTLNRMDAVGFNVNVNDTCDLLREGSNLGPASGSTLEHTFFRKQCDFVGGCTTPGIPKDTNNASVDFLFADTLGTQIIGTGQQLGAPGPENKTSPIRRDTSGIGVLFLDSTKTAAQSPNRVRDLTPGNPSFAANGTLSVRRRVTNGTGANVTRLRFRIVEITTFPTPGGGIADLRALSTPSTITVSPINDPGTCFAGTGSATTPCSVTVQQTTLEEPPTQSVGGGMNSTLAAGTVTLGTPLPPGGSIMVNFLLGVQTPGTFRFLIIVEALP